MYKDWLKSSQDPEKISESIKGGITALSSLIVLVGLRVFDLNITNADVLTFATCLGTIAGAIIGIKGLLMKAVVKVGSIK